MADRDPLLISMPTGWSVRDFIYTGIVDRLAQVHDVVVLVPDRWRMQFRRHVPSASFTIETLADASEPLSWKFFRQLRKKIFLEVNRFETERIKERADRRALVQVAGGRVVRTITRLPGARRLVSSVEDVDSWLNRDRLYGRLLDDHHPFLVLGTSPFQYAEEALIRAAWRRGIPTACYVPSWDNLSSKGVISQRHRRVLVWNEIMRGEILSGYPRYGPEQVRVVGIPQFDVYMSPPALGYAAWCRRYGLDATRQTILYSTTSPRLYQYDPEIIGRLATDIVEGQFPTALQILVRCHPYDNPRRYEHLCQGPVRICPSSLAPGLGEEYWLPAPDELEVLRDCIAHSALNINVASTMSLDAAACGKPVLNVAFDGADVLSYERSAARFYDYSHYRRVSRSGAVRVCSTYGQLRDGIRDYTEHPELDREARFELIRTMGFDGHTSGVARCTEELLTLAEEARAGRAVEPARGQSVSRLGRK